MLELENTIVGIVPDSMSDMDNNKMNEECKATTDDATDDGNETDPSNRNKRSIIGAPPRAPYEKPDSTGKMRPIFML